MNNGVDIKNKLNPYWVTGFTYGEGCFMINNLKNKKINKWEIRPVFKIGLHKRDLDLLLQIQKFFIIQVIFIYINLKRFIKYKVEKI